MIERSNSVPPYNDVTLVGVIQKHLESRQIEATVQPDVYGPNEGLKALENRCIQVIPDGWSGSICYEYRKGHWEIYFNFYLDDPVVAKVHQQIKDWFEGNKFISWQPWADKENALLVLTHEVEDDGDCEDFKASFDALFNLTYLTLNSAILAATKSMS